jgi:hypothetical protein
MPSHAFNESQGNAKSLAIKQLTLKNLLKNMISQQ